MQCCCESGTEADTDSTRCKHRDRGPILACYNSRIVITITHGCLEFAGRRQRAESDMSLPLYKHIHGASPTLWILPKISPTASSVTPFMVYVLPLLVMP